MSRGIEDVKIQLDSRTDGRITLTIKLIGWEFRELRELGGVPPPRVCRSTTFGTLGSGCARGLGSDGGSTIGSRSGPRSERSTDAQRTFASTLDLRLNPRDTGDE